MPVEFIYGEDRLTAVLNGDIDHHSAAEMRIMIDGELERTMPKTLLLDFAEVGFMDSSGIGVIVGRYQKIACFGGRVIAIHASERIKRIILMSGMQRFIEISETEYTV